MTLDSKTLGEKRPRDMAIGYWLFITVGFVMSRAQVSMRNDSFRYVFPCLAKEFLHTHAVEGLATSSLDLRVPTLETSVESL